MGSGSGRFYEKNEIYSEMIFSRIGGLKSIRGFNE